MPKSSSIAQQRLMGMAYTIKKGYKELSDYPEEFHEELKDVLKMSLKSLRKFAKTKHDGLPYKVKETKLFPSFEDFLEEYSSLDSVPGVGSVSFPGGSDSISVGRFMQQPGSGDMPTFLKSKEDEDEEEEEEEKRRKKNKVNLNKQKSAQTLLGDI